MKRISTILAALSLVLLVSAAYAHPPSEIKITFDPQTRILSAVVIHNVGNPVSHYINNVAVGLNGKEIISQKIPLQDNNENQAVSYLIPDTKEGDVISVEGYCSISGKLAKEITVTLVK